MPTPSTQNGEVVPVQLAMHAAHLARRARLWKRPARPRAVAPQPPAPVQVVEYIEDVLPDGAPLDFYQPPSSKTIIRLVSLKHGLKPSELVGPRRTHPIIKARDEAVFLVHTHRPWLSLPEIGRIFGGRDHTTILHIITKFTGRRGRLYAD
jgi:hypothetical protein